MCEWGPQRGYYTTTFEEYCAITPAMPPKMPPARRAKSEIRSGARGNDKVGDFIAAVSVYYHEQLIPYCESFDLKKLFRIHALWLVSVGFFLTFMPHGILHIFMPKMDHMTHEIYRLYGALNISIGYIVWKLRYIGDGRVVGRLIAETFCVCFYLQALVILRAQVLPSIHVCVLSLSLSLTLTRSHPSISLLCRQLTNPAGHDFWHWMLALTYLVYGSLYGYIRFVKKIKTFELPGSSHED